MVGTIPLMVHGSTTARRYALLALYSASHALGAVVVGSTIAALGYFAMPHAVNNTRLLCFGILCFIFSLHEMRILRLPLPQFKRQVPKRWRRLPAAEGVCLYGALLGVGIGTRISSASYYAVLLWVLLAAPASQGLVAMVVFGLARAVPICFVSLFYRDRKADDLMCYLLGQTRFLHVLNGAVLLFVGVLLCKPWPGLP